MFGLLPILILASSILAHSPIDGLAVFTLVSPAINRAESAIAGLSKEGFASVSSKNAFVSNLDQVTSVLSKAVTANPAIVKRRNGDSVSRVRASESTTVLLAALAKLVNSLADSTTAANITLPFLNSTQAILSQITDSKSGAESSLGPLLSSTTLQKVLSNVLSVGLVSTALNIYGIEYTLSNLFGTTFSKSILNLLLSPKSSISSILNPAVTSQILSILSNNATEIAQNSTILSFLSTDTIAALQNSTTEAVTGLLSTLNSTVESLASPKFVEALLHLGAQAGSNNTQLIDLVGTLTTALGL